jgi:hypothetical protein
MIETISLLTVALLFGGITCYSFGFAAFLFSALPPDLAGLTLRRAFPHFYIFVMVTSAVAAALVWPQDNMSSILLLIITLTTLPTRQMLMPAINTATDSGRKTRFKVLHSISVLISLAHISITAIVLMRCV